MRKSWGDKPKNMPFNYVISHEKKLRRQSHKLLNIRHLNFPTFRVHLHKNTWESAVFGKKEQQQQQNLPNNFCYLFPRARLQDRHKEAHYESELRCCSGGHGSHSKTQRSDYKLGVTLSRLLWEECAFWQILLAVEILRRHDSVMVLGSTSATTALSEHANIICWQHHCIPVLERVSIKGRA